ncbi:MAG: hypothetical protein P4L53_18365 [Candidatus Obscuribacterales bacterium]|nr:hypothetical protein [Candidatus Obscuribacterales bacterium]
MTTENTNTATAVQSLVDGEILIGTVHRPFIDQDKLRGAILSFPGRKETALLHIKQIKGTEPEKRLASFRLGEEVEVKILVHGSAGAPKIWASEIALAAERSVLDELAAAAEAKTTFRGRTVNISKFGIFVDLMEGPAKGQRGLIHNSNLYQKGAGLGGLSQSLQPNNDVALHILGAKIDSAGTMRIDLALAELSA